MHVFCFTVDDNIRFLKEVTENKFRSIFEHPYLAMYKRLHEEYAIKVQLNLFYRMKGFDLSQMPNIYYKEFEENSNWLKFSFHSDFETVKPYEFSGYDEVYYDCKKVNDNIKRFASNSALAKTTTIHYCSTTDNGLKALTDNHVVGLLGLFGNQSDPRTSYELNDKIARKIRNGKMVTNNKMTFASIDIVLNSFSEESILAQLNELKERECIKIMIHEQYFYPDYIWYQPDFEAKLRATFHFLKKHSYKSVFLEDLI